MVDATCMRMFQFRVRPGKEQAYRDYVRDVVDPIDAAAHDADVFLTLVTIFPDGEIADGDWNHGRVFTFRDADHRARMADSMARIAAKFDGSDEARIRRKQYAESLRALIAVRDYTFG